ncbi:MAG: ribosome hibernation-promoting factor, HPF/YfiA family [Caulobacteraceae bacterium]
MQVQVTGKQIDVGEALRSRITGDLSTSIGKYFERGGDADVVVGHEGHAIRVDCRVRLASGQRLESHGSGADAHAAFDAALDKIERRVRRYKRRLKDHQAQPSQQAAYTVLMTPDVEGDGWDAEEAPANDAPPSGVVIAETEQEVKTMTVSMAVMEMDLTQAPVIVFRNAAHGGLSVIYRRSDGHIGWIDPERTQPPARNVA